MKKITIPPYLFRNLDIRGADPEFVKSQDIDPNSLKAKSAYASPLNPEIGCIIGRALADAFKPKKVVVGYDARLSSPSLSNALTKGLTEQGVDVDLIGLATTDKLYFAIGHFKYDLGVMVTGSHTIKQLNGYKISKYKEGTVVPIAKGTGMELLKETALKQNFKRTTEKGTLNKINISKEFEQHILSFFKYRKFKSQKIVFDAGNGSAGLNFEKIINVLPINADKLNFKPDGNFPNHEPDPMIAENLKELLNVLKNKDMDFGVAWDGDADRISFISKKRGILTGGFIAAILLNWVFEKHPHSTIIYTTPMSWAVRKMTEKHNGKAEYAKVGNSYVKMAMHEFKAPFAGEEANHFMFTETFCAESGILPLLIILELLTKKDCTFDQLLNEVVGDFRLTGDVNIEVHDSDSVLNKLAHKFEDEGASISRFDGLMVSLPEYHFSIRPSSNDPVLRLNLEAESRKVVEKQTEMIKSLVKEFDT